MLHIGLLIIINGPSFRKLCYKQYLGDFKAVYKNYFVFLQNYAWNNTNNNTKIWHNV